MTANSTDRENFNDLKTYIISSYRYCQKVYESIENDEQYESWFNLCNNHLNNCNFLINAQRPNFLDIIINRNYVNLFNDFRDSCEFTVESIQGMMNEYNANKTKLDEEIEMFNQLEKKARFEYGLAEEFKEMDIQNKNEYMSKRAIGFLNKLKEDD